MTTYIVTRTVVSIIEADSVMEAIEDTILPLASAEGDPQVVEIAAKKGLT